MTQRDNLKCIHEPFGDAYYYGLERLGTRYDDDEKARIDSGFAQSTFQTILNEIEKEGVEVRHLISAAIQSFSLSLSQKYSQSVDIC